MNKNIDCRDYNVTSNPAAAESHDAVSYARDTAHGQPGNPLASNEIKMSSSKAKKILKDGTVHGKPLTSKQRGLFGAVAGKGK